MNIDFIIANEYRKRVQHFCIVYPTLSIAGGITETISVYYGILVFVVVYSLIPCLKKASNGEKLNSYCAIFEIFCFDK